MEQLCAQDLDQACRELTAIDSLASGRVLRPRVTLDELVFPDEIAAELREVSAHFRHRARVLREWGFGARTGRADACAVLLSGPSGVGKSAAAEALAGALETELLCVDLSSIVSKYLGDTERALARTFEAAEGAGRMTLFFDEADALFGRRTETNDSHDRWANVQIDYLLQRLENHRGLVVLATNRKADLDRAFLRRIRFAIDIPLPDHELRRRLWRASIPMRAPQEELDWERLAGLELAGGSILNVALRAAFLAAEERRPIAMRHLLACARREYAKQGQAAAPARLKAEKGRKP
ncbi:MAG: ATP-binding protein [Planctomycetota bacterium]